MPFSPLSEDFERSSLDQLFGAAESGDIATLKLLRDRGADMHAFDDLALVLAAARRHAPAVEFLRDCGANMGVLDELAEEATARGYKDFAATVRSYSRLAAHRAASRII